MVVACERFENVQQIFMMAKQYLGEILSAFEFVDRTCLDIVLDVHGGNKHGSGPGLRDPMAERHGFYLLLETSGSNEHHDVEKIEAFCSAVLDTQHARDAVIARDGAQMEALWGLRENASASFQTKFRGGRTWKYDLSLPLAQFYQIVEEVRARLVGIDSAVVVGFGHIGDCNVHLNVGTASADPVVQQAIDNRIEPFIFEYTAGARGSISAEHGIGLFKKDYLHYSQNPTAISLMKALKETLDPAGILNPYKIFR